jgi:diguanylate cyclase (GGDEF)-like protein
VDLSVENSIVGLAIQCAGILLVAILSFLLTRSVRRRFFNYWAVAWGCLTFSLAALLVTLWLGIAPKLCYSLYFFGEYAFGYLLIAGCRDFARGLPPPRRYRWLLLAAGLVALTLPHAAQDFTTILVPHTAILAGFWTAAYFVLRPAFRKKQRGPGLWVASVALVLLALDFAQYVPGCAYVAVHGRSLGFAYLKYSSLYDLILETLLAFGLVMVVMESVHHELEVSNRELAAATGRLRILAEQDPLTGSLNRHAFCSLTEDSPNSPLHTATGSVVVVDVDNFKAINDTLGHKVGDLAIRTVARTIRSVIRADDLLFRWGGDEFLLLLAGLRPAEALARLEKVNATLARTCLEGPGEPPELGISFGVAPFAGTAALDQAIEEADRVMYQRKQARKVASSSGVRAAVASVHA